MQLDEPYPRYSLLRREFSAYFFSPIAYVVLAVFLAVTGVLFGLTLAGLTAHGPTGVEYPLQRMLSDRWFWLVLLQKLRRLHHGRNDQT